ncbi:MAG: hypothetical protein JWQ40_3312 [Segetibacter sp.]|jgi:hypothetical protein|nr:hypothetical protein [Segetibacter sp.]
MLYLADIFFTILHFIIIGFNLFGWISYKTRKAHFITILLTAASWFILGIWFGLGYCPVTDWQWQVKQKLGETNLPNSFIKYYGDKITGLPLNAEFVDLVTGIAFLLATLASAYVNFFYKKKAKSSTHTLQ